MPNGARVVVDRNRCVGNGICEGLQPEVFEVGSDGIVIVHEEKVGEADPEQLANAVHSCPAQALELVDEP
jgi:ferredoxin